MSGSDNYFRSGHSHHDVFISYAQQDKPIADAVCSRLEARHIRCWIAPRDVSPAKEFPAAIIEGIDGSGVMVLIFSSHANNSPHVIRELTNAVNKGRIIVPFRIEDVELVDTRLTAASGNFKDITYFGMLWQPSPVEGVSQSEVDLGHATSALGLDSPLVLPPTATVDFLTLLDNESDNPEGECPGLGVRIAGSVPAAEDMPEIDVQISVRITGRIGS